MSPGEGMTTAARAGNKREQAIRRQQLAVLRRVKLFSQRERKTVGAASRCCVLPGPACPGLLAGWVPAGAGLPAEGLLLGAWAAEPAPVLAQL